MGNEASLHMEMATNFDAEEIKRLGKRFKKLDIDNSGSLSVDEFMTLPELQQNPLVQRVIDIFDEVSKSSTRRFHKKLDHFYKIRHFCHYFKNGLAFLLKSWN